MITKKVVLCKLPILWTSSYSSCGFRRLMPGETEALISNDNDDHCIEYFPSQNEVDEYQAADDSLLQQATLYSQTPIQPSNRWHVQWSTIDYSSCSFSRLIHNKQRKKQQSARHLCTKLPSPGFCLRGYSCEQRHLWLSRTTTYELATARPALSIIMIEKKHDCMKQEKSRRWWMTAMNSFLILDSHQITISNYIASVAVCPRSGTSMLTLHTTELGNNAKYVG